MHDIVGSLAGVALVLSCGPAFVLALRICAGIRKFIRAEGYQVSMPTPPRIAIILLVHMTGTVAGVALIIWGVAG